MTFITSPAPVVVDASITVGAATGEGPALAVFDTLTGSGAMLLAPPLLWIETANSLTRAKRYSPVETTSVLRVLHDVGIESADRGEEGLAAAIGLADRHGLSVYDAIYLWLAIDVDGELATLDKPLARAAAAEGVALMVQP